MTEVLSMNATVLLHLESSVTSRIEVLVDARELSQEAQFQLSRALAYTQPGWTVKMGNIRSEQHTTTDNTREEPRHD